MTNLRTYVALTATIAFIAIGQSMNAQDDLDDLLADLEGESPAAAPAAPAAEEKAEEPAAEEPAAEEPAAEEPAPAAEEPAAEEPAAEEPAPAAEEPAAAEEKVDDALDLLDELAAEDSDSKPEAPTAEEPAPEESSDKDPLPVPDGEQEDDAPAITPVSRAALADRKDGKLIDEILTTEKLRREALDVQAMREIREAKDAMASGQYVEAVRHYGIAVKLLNDSPTAMRYKSECTEGIAEGLYRAALEEERTGRRARAIKYMEKAVDLRHPKARRQLEAAPPSEAREAASCAARARPRARRVRTGARQGSLQPGGDPPQGLHRPQERRHPEAGA